jgi:hypothetical protein
LERLGRLLLRYQRSRFDFGYGPVTVHANDLNLLAKTDKYRARRFG